MRAFKKHALTLTFELVAIMGLFYLVKVAATHHGWVAAAIGAAVWVCATEASSRKAR